MRKHLILAAVTLTVLPRLAMAQASLAEAAELSLHRIERLVDIKKIDKSYRDQLREVSIVRLPQSTSSDPVFKAVGSQVAGQDGTRNQIDIFMDANGKATPLDPSHLHPGSPAYNPPVWPQKDAVTLLENTIHYIENNKADGGIKPFFDGMTNLTLSQVMNGGSPVAKVEVKSSLTTATLTVLLSLDGNVMSAAFFAPGTEFN